VPRGLTLRQPVRLHVFVLAAQEDQSQQRGRKHQIFAHFMSPRCTAASANTIIRLDISRSKVLKDV